jgi:hypothetical protein
MVLREWCATGVGYEFRSSRSFAVRPREHPDCIGVAGPVGAAGRQIGDCAGTRAGLAPRAGYHDPCTDDYGAADNDDRCTDNDERCTDHDDPGTDNDGSATDHDDPGTDNDPVGTDGGDGVARTDGTGGTDGGDRPVVAKACEAAPVRTPACSWRVAQ